MKKIFLLFIILLLALTFVKSNADCPPGYTEYSYNATYSYEYPSGGGYFTCHVIVIYCCKWDNNLKKVVSEITEVRPQYSYNYCLAYLPSINDFFDWLHEETVKHAQASCQPLYPPCDDEENPYYTFTINIARCWYYKNLILYQGDDIYSTVLRKCNYSFDCVSTWRVCLDYNYSPAKLTYTLVTKYPNGTPTCSTTIPTLPPQGKTWNEYWETECFSLECN